MIFLFLISHMIGWLDNCMNVQVIVVPNKVDSDCRREWVFLRKILTALRSEGQESHWHYLFVCPTADGLSTWALWWWSQRSNLHSQHFLFSPKACAWCAATAATRSLYVQSANFFLNLSDTVLSYSIPPYLLENSENPVTYSKWLSGLNTRVLGLIFASQLTTFILRDF